MPWASGGALPEAPYGAQVRANGWRFELHVERLVGSDSFMSMPPRLRGPWLLLLALSWLEVPCGSLPGSDDALARKAGLDLAEFQAGKEHLLRHWKKHSDGRLYHPVVTEFVLRLLGAREKEAAKKGEQRSKAKEGAKGSKKGGGDIEGDKKVVPGESQGTNGESRRVVVQEQEQDKPPLYPPKGGLPCPGFDRFWSAWPAGHRKVDKAGCQRKWLARGLEAEAEAILAHLDAMKGSPDWQKQGGAYVPMPSTYLNQRRWEGQAGMQGRPAGGLTREQELAAFL